MSISITNTALFVGIIQANLLSFMIKSRNEIGRRIKIGENKIDCDICVMFHSRCGLYKRSAPMTAHPPTPHTLPPTHLPTQPHVVFLVFFSLCRFSIWKYFSHPGSTRFSEDLKCWGAWDTTCGYKANDITPSIAWRREAWKEEALDDIPWKDERGPSSIRRTLEPFQRQQWENLILRETVLGAYGLFFPVHTYHLQLKWTKLNWTPGSNFEVPALMNS